MPKKEQDIQCVKHGAFLRPSNFYMANIYSVFSGIGRIPICKNCLYEMVEKYAELYGSVREAIYYTCRKIDLAFNDTVYHAHRNENDTPTKTLQLYITQMNSLGGVSEAGNVFDNGEHIENVKANLSEEDLSKIKKAEALLSRPDLKMNEEDLRIKSEVIEMLERDPFAGYSESDQKKLYADLLGYLDDEDIIEDSYLLSQIIQIVVNNLQIEDINFTIGQYMADKESIIRYQGEISALSDTKKKIADSNDKIAKENGLTVKARGSRGSGKSSLTIMMEKLAEMGFDKAKENFYTQGLAEGMRKVADMSHRSISEQMKFDENDTRDIITMQRDTIREYERKIADIEEEKRQLHEELTELRG